MMNINYNIKYIPEGHMYKLKAFGTVNLLLFDA